MKGVGVAVLMVALLAGCSSHHQSRADIISAGQVDIQLPPGWTVTRHGASAPPVQAAPATGAGAQAAPAGAAGPAQPAAAPGSTIPLAKEDPTTAFFQATSDFSSCLKGLGVKFVGAPDPKNPNSPANGPNYIKSLTTCAAQTQQQSGTGG